MQCSDSGNEKQGERALNKYVHEDLQFWVEHAVVDPAFVDRKSVLHRVASYSDLEYFRSSIHFYSSGAVLREP